MLNLNKEIRRKSYNERLIVSYKEGSKPHYAPNGRLMLLVERNKKKDISVFEYVYPLALDDCRNMNNIILYAKKGVTKK